jgi:hypothetical protein
MTGDQMQVVLSQQAIDAVRERLASRPALACPDQGADKPVMVHRDALVDLREKLIRKIGQMREHAYRRAPGGVPSRILAPPWI